MIKRVQYLNILNNYRDKPFIKVLTGLRRVGKSTLIDLYIDKLLSDGINSNNILKLNFELPENFDITDYKILTEHILSWENGKTGPLYIFLDEVGRVSQWERAVNGLHALKKFDLYITGSNADLLSSDLSTFLAGRYIEILIYPFSYLEFKMAYPGSNFNDFITFGGIPSIKPFNLEYDLSMNILRDSFKSALLQDIISRYQIRNAGVLEKLILYLFTNVGKTFSALSISKYFKSQAISVSVDTILSYLKMIEDAHLIYRIARSDLIGKQVLKTEEKYYISDHGIREAICGNNIKIIEMILENIILQELLRRGFKVHVGKVNNCEIDFVATKGAIVNYYQVSYLLESEETRKREFGVYQHLSDNYPKYVISMDKLNFSQNGIIHINIEDFLLENQKNESND